jgi:hypothetical protein
MLAPVVQPRAVPLWERAATTVLVPLLVLAAGRVALPYAAGEGSILGLGLTPFLTAFGLVELAALVVPSWRRARHERPARRRLEQAAVVVALLFALAQAGAMVTSLRGADVLAGGALDAVAAACALAGGSCLLALAARWITRRGLVNGFVLIWAVTVVEGLLRSGRWLIVPLAAGARSAAVLGVALAAVVAATCVAVGGRARSPLPIPASSIYPVGLATALVGAPAALAGLHLPVQSLVRALADSQTYALAALAVALGATFAAAPLMHRADEVAALLRRLGAGDFSPSAASSLLWGAMPPTIAYVATLVVADAALARVHAGVSVTSIALVAAAAVDLVSGARLHARVRDLVVVREERRAYAVEPTCAALARRGVAAYARGRGVVSLLQAFGPYAPAEILVAAGDAERAGAVLGELLERETPEPSVAEPPVAFGAPVSIPHTIALAVMLAAAVGAWRVPLASAAERASAPRVSLEVVRVDDEADPLAAAAGEQLPEGVALYSEAAPLGVVAGRRRAVARSYARVVPRPGEALVAAWSRVQPWLQTHPLPAGARWSCQTVTEASEDAPAAWREVGLRTMVLTGDAIATAADVTDAQVSVDPESLSPYSVVIAFGAAASERFRVATRDWIGRRIALVIDGRVDSAPVVLSEIAGGHATITMGPGDPDRQLADARRLAAGLSGR